MLEPAQHSLHTIANDMPSSLDGGLTWLMRLSLIPHRRFAQGEGGKNSRSTRGVQPEIFQGWHFRGTSGEDF